MIFPVTMGVGLAIQTAVNSKLRTFVLSPYLSSGLSFFIAWLFLMILSLLMHQQLLVSYTTLLQEPMWLWIGGLFGAIALTGNCSIISKNRKFTNYGFADNGKNCNGYHY
nr:DMT family transporter [Companilactobacillus halodurans]